MDAVRDIFVSTGQSMSGAAKAVLTFIETAPAIALFDIARSWYFHTGGKGGETRQYYHSVKWWVRNYRDSEQPPAPGYGLAGAPPGPSQY